MSDAARLLAAAKRQHAAGEIDAACESCRRILAGDPDNAVALELLGVVAGQRGETSAAIALLEHALAGRPSDPNLLSNLGAVYRAAGRLDEAEARYREALAMEPGSVQARFNLANLLSARGLADAALREYVMVLDGDASHAGALNNMAMLLKAQGRYVEAETVYRRLIAVRPSDAAARSNLGALLMDLGRINAAIMLYREAIELNPKAPEPYNNLGVALQSLRRSDEALAAYDFALALKPDYSEVQFNRGQTLAIQGDPEGAEEALAAALGIRSDPRYRLVHASLLPIIPRSQGDVDRWRARFESEIKKLIEGRLVLENAPLDCSVMSFYLAYHGLNDRHLMEMLSRLYRQACPMLQWVAPHCAAAARHDEGRRIRVGFYSAYLREHAVAWTLQGLLLHLPKERFEIFVFATGRTDEPVMPTIGAVADTLTVLPQMLEEARRRIAAAELDVLIYTDIGMEQLGYGLAHARLASVQCAIWGHPVTSGIPTIDYYLSNDFAEPEDADAHYSERLVRLGGVQTCYRRPVLPPRDGSALPPGIPEDATLYLCPQSLFKIHPDMDRFLAEILRRDPNGVLVLFEGTDRVITERLRARWADVFGAAMDRVRFLPRMRFEQFLAVVVQSDILLDTWPFGSGNTSYQGFAAGKPIVTLPGKYLRGRGVLAHYRHMGFMDCVADTAEAYVDIAVRLGTDAEFYRHVTTLIGERSGVLFDDARGAQDLTRFLIEVAA